MKNKKYYQFERNRYFYGKLMTVRDFEAEQRYFNDKRRLVNRLMYGSGIACGLDVVAVDDKTISVEMGVAFDYGGREIVVPSPVIRKLSTIDGYTDNEDAKDVYLCIEYDEKGKEPINSVVNSSSYSEESSEFNRYQETYRLFLKEEIDNQAVNAFKSLTEDEQVVYNDNRVCISQIVPKYVNPSQEFEIIVVVEKKLEFSGLSFEYELNADFFGAKSDDGKIRISFNEPERGQKGRYEEKYVLKAEDATDVHGKLELDESTFKLTYGGKTMTSCMKYRADIDVIQSSIRERLKEDYFNLTMDKVLQEDEEDIVCLAKISLLKAGGVYVIQGIQKVPFNQFVYNTSMLKLLGDTDSRHGPSSFSAKAVSYPLDISQNPVVKANFNRDSNVFDFSFGIPVPQKEVYRYATGVETIELGLDAKMNKKYYSGEIEHGLGPGPVYIVLGIEQSREDNSILTHNNQHMLFGSKDVFKKSQYEPDVPDVTTGAVVYTQRGTFCIGVKLHDATDEGSIKVRWIAFKYNDAATEKESYGSEKIEVKIVPDTITMKVREKLKLKSVVSGTGNTKCKWMLAEPGSGEINENGVYEAPSTPGVYEVVAQSEECPEKKASAFIVVKE